MIFSFFLLGLSREAQRARAQVLKITLSQQFLSPSHTAVALGLVVTASSYQEAVKVH